MKNKKFYIITLTLLILNYIFLFYEFNFCTINFHLTETLIIAMPIVLIGLIYILVKKEQLNNKVALAISIILIIFCMILNFIVMTVIMFEEGTSYENNPLRYKHIRDISGYASYTYQFPEKIPQKILNKNAVKFYYTPQFLQGGFNLELLLKMEDEEIDEYITKYKDKAKEIVEVNEENINSLYSKYGIYEPYGIFEDTDAYKEFINGSAIYLLDFESYKPNDWNHGYTVYMEKNDNLNQLLLVSQVW